MRLNLKGQNAEKARKGHFMKWRNAKRVAPINGKLCLFYLGDYEYRVGRIFCVADDDTEYLIMQERDGEELIGFKSVKEWAYITEPEV